MPHYSWGIIRRSQRDSGVVVCSGFVHVCCPGCWNAAREINRSHSLFYAHVFSQAAICLFIHLITGHFWAELIYLRWLFSSCFHFNGVSSHYRLPSHQRFNAQAYGGSCPHAHANRDTTVAGLFTPTQSAVWGVCVCVCDRESYSWPAVSWQLRNPSPARSLTQRPPHVIHADSAVSCMSDPSQPNGAMEVRIMKSRGKVDIQVFHPAFK